MEELDRRNVGLCALELLPPHRAAGRRLVVCASHLMTKSRDSSRTVRFPGEVRATQLETISQELSAFLGPTEMALFMGDFNINVRGDDETYILHGKLASAGGDEALTVPTGYEDLRSREPFPETGSRFLWFRRRGADEGCIDEPTDGVATRLSLRDVYGDLNRLERDDRGRVLGTSHNADRLETIDYIFFDEDHMELVARSPMLAPSPDAAPDEENPSDHIPLLARLRVKAQ